MPNFNSCRLAVGKEMIVIVKPTFGAETRHKYTGDILHARTTELDGWIRRIHANQVVVYHSKIKDFLPLIASLK
jgi:hypothetical protein